MTEPGKREQGGQEPHDASAAGAGTPRANNARFCPGIGSRISAESAVPPRSFLREQLPRGAVYGLGIGVINFLGTACMCGHHDTMSLPGDLIALGLTGTAFFSRSASWMRPVVCIALTLVGMMFLMNAHNILWSGHSPILGR